MLRLFLGGLALASAAAFAHVAAREAILSDSPAAPTPTNVAQSNAKEIQVAKRRRRRVRTRATAPEPTQKPAGQARVNGEVLFGVQDVGFLVDRDVIRVGSEIGKFDRIRLRVLKNDIHIVDLKAYYENGDFETLIADEKIRANRKTNWIKLNRDDFIKEFRVIYRSRPDFKGQARVEVFGEYKPGWLGPNGEGVKYNNGWVLLGTDTAGSIGFDRVKIPVGKNEGGFKKLRVSVKDRDVTMADLTVVYEDGAKDDLQSRRTHISGRRRLRAGGLEERRGDQGDPRRVALARDRDLEAHARVRDRAGLGASLGGRSGTRPHLYRGRLRRRRSDFAVVKMTIGALSHKRKSTISGHRAFVSRRKVCMELQCGRWTILSATLLTMSGRPQACVTPTSPVEGRH